MLAARGPGDHHACRRLPGPLAHDGQGPKVAHGALVERGGADDPLQVGPHSGARAAQRPASQPVRIGTPNPHGPA